MNAGAPSRLTAVFRQIVARRRLVVLLYALVVPIAVLQALRVESDSSISRLVVASDEDFRNNQEFQRLFPEGEQVVLLLEAPDPFAPRALERLDAVERRLAGLERVSAFSALALFDRVRPGARATPGWEEEFRRFATGTDLLRRQGL